MGQGGRAGPPTRAGGGAFLSAGSPPKRGGDSGGQGAQSGVWSMSSMVLERRSFRGGDLEGGIYGALAAARGREGGRGAGGCGGEGGSCGAGPS